MFNFFRNKKVENVESHSTKKESSSSFQNKMDVLKNDLNDLISHKETLTETIEDVKSIDISLYSDYLNFHHKSLPQNHLQDLILFENYISTELEALNELLEHDWIEKNIFLSNEGFDRPEIKDIVCKALDIIIDSPSISGSLLQRTLKIKYEAVASLMDELEGYGFISPFTGGHRILLIKPTDVHQAKSTKNYISQTIQLKMLPCIEKVTNYHQVINKKSLDNAAQDFITRYNHLDKMVALGVLMVNSLLEGDNLTFQRIYVNLDKHSVFNRNWQNEIAQKLDKLCDNLDLLNVRIGKLSYQILRLEDTIIAQANRLSTELSSYAKNLDDNLKTMSDGINDNLKGIRQDVSIYALLNRRN